MSKNIILRLHEKRRIIDAITILAALEIIGLIPVNFLQISISNPVLLVFILLISWFIAASNTKLYKDRISNKYVEEIVIVLNTLVIQFILIAAFLFIYNKKIYLPIKFLVCFQILFGFVQLLVKYAIRKKIHYDYLHDSSMLQKLLIVGSAESTLKLSQTIKANFFYGYNCIGYLSEEDRKLADVNYLGHPDELAEVLKKYKIEKVIVALPSLSESLIRYFLETCDNHGIKTFIVPNYYQFTSTSFEINQIGLIPVINLRALPLDKSENKFLKRAFDIIFSSLFLLLIGSWLFPLLAILIKLNSKGPVFFKQERWGINNKKMNCYKFRTMNHQKAGENEFVQATKNDPRVTSLGKWLRSLSIDETPQFWNVLIDNMSVVGPRPHVTPQNLEYSEKIESYLLRHQVKPGLTGWAQVNGARGETPDIEHMQTRVNYDLYYVHQWNFWLDIQIVLQTILNVFKADKHAY
ncbi:MAG: undecaprenyl-phosphate glucose phosphotransferase [Chitinophagia bacterium]|nr:undecaprenyl-phosphate glucose phosphotransferase [Chitinophagia bacterium]